MEDVQSKNDVLIAWEVDEYPAHERSLWWYLIAGMIALGLIVYAIASANFIFAIIMLMIGVIVVVSAMKAPDRVRIAVTSNGIAVDNAFYAYPQVKDFSLVYRPPDAKWLYVDFESAWNPLLAIPLEEVDPNEVRRHLLPYCIENLTRTEERFVDIFRRKYKL